MADPSSWDILDEDCSDISDWLDLDSVKAESKVDPAGQFCFAGINQVIPKRARSDFTAPNVFTTEIKIFHDDLDDAYNYFVFECEAANEKLLLNFKTSGLFIIGTAAVEVGIDLVKYGGSVEWQTWRFLVTFTDAAGNGTCDVYLNDSTHDWEKVGTSISCDNTNVGQYKCELLLYRADGTNHLDYIKIATGLYTPGVVSNVKSVNGILTEKVYSIDGMLVENTKSIDGITIQ